MKLVILKEDHEKDRVMLDPSDDDSMVCKDHPTSISDGLYEQNKEMLIIDAPSAEILRESKEPEKAKPSKRRR